MKQLLYLLMLLALLFVPQAMAEEQSGTLIVYFSVPEDVELNGVDAVAGASVLVKDLCLLRNIRLCLFCL